TFLDFLTERISGKVTIESPFEQMEYVLTKKETKNFPLRMKSMDYLSSLDFKKLIDSFAADLNTQGIEFSPITFRGKTLVPAEDIQNYFYNLDQGIAIPNKMELVAKWLLQELQLHQKKELMSDWVMEKIELLDTEDYMRVYHHAEKQSESST